MLNLANNSPPSKEAQTSKEAQKNLETQALARMQKVRANLLFSHPFFGSLALKLNLKADVHCANLWTDGKTLAFNPHFIAVLSEEQLQAAQAHEILHIACNHHLRRKGRDEKLWNRACDYAINSLLLEAGFSLSEAYFEHDSQYDEKSVDEIYTLLAKMTDHEVHGGAQEALVSEQSDASTDNAISASADDASENEGQEHQEKKAQGQKKDDVEDQEDDLVQTKGNAASDTLSEDGKAGEFFGEIRDHPLIAQQSKENERKAEEEALIQLSQAMHSAEGHGDIPLGLLRLYHTRIRPKLDWQSLLHRFVENCFDGDYSWSMPNRRYISQDIYLPSRLEPRIPIIALAIDASGSVDAQMLSVFCTELENILESYDTTLFIMYHDTVVQKHDQYTRVDRPLRLMVHGAGGTSYKDIPNYLEKEYVYPACLLWFTDFECADFPQEPDYPVLWIASKKIEQMPPFGQVISIVEKEFEE